MENRGGNSGIHGKGGNTNVRAFVAVVKKDSANDKAPAIQDPYAEPVMDKPVMDKPVKAAGAQRPAAVGSPDTSRKKAPNPEAVAARPQQRKAGSGKRRHGLIIAGIVFTLLIVIGGGCVLGYFLTIVDAILVDGCDTYSDIHIINMSGLYTGKNIFTYDLDTAKANICNDPYIEVIEIKRMLPSSIHITVRERQEYAAVVGAGGTYYIIDEFGFILNISRRDDVGGLVLVNGLSTGGFLTGTSIDMDKSVLRNYTLCQILQNFIAHDEGIASVDLSNISNVRLNTHDGFTVCLGDTENLEQKLSQMYSALGQLRQKHTAGGVIYINGNGVSDYSIGTPAPTATPESTQLPSPEPTDNAPDG